LTELIRVEGLSAGYGASVVLEDVGFSLASHGSLALLGRNGVGKSTLLMTLMGLTRQHRGQILLSGVDLSRQATHRRAHAGLGWVPQERWVFPSLTVAEHLSAVARPGPFTQERIYALFPRLLERRRNLGNQLSGGEQQMLAIARALVTNPRVLLLDEPMEGLAPIIVQELAAVMRALCADRTLALMVVEQHARLALSLTEEVLVLDRGRIVHRGKSADLAADEALQARLLAVS
jgi:branched-chain amino acid transport system ATP-binding protein